MSEQIPGRGDVYRENSPLLVTMKDFTRVLSHHLPRRLSQARETGRAMRSIGRRKGKR